MEMKKSRVAPGTYRTRLLGLCLAAAAVGVPCAVLAQTAPAPVAVKWSAVDLRGGKVEVPLADRPTVVLFVRGDQPQSKQAVQKAQEILRKADAVQAVIVLSGQQDAAAPANSATALGWAGPVVLDANYAASGNMGVHVWPTTVVVAASGAQVAHLPGISTSYGSQLDAYVAFAAGKIDRAALAQKLSNSDVVGDTAEQMATRHLQVAQRLMDKGLLDQGQAELTEGLKRQPKNAQLQVAMTKVMLRRGDVKQAMSMADALSPDAVPAWQRNLLKGQVLVATQQWDAALSVLQEAMKLNPEPAEAQYELGRVYSHKGDWQHAAEAFKAAFEATPAGKSIAPPASK